MLRLTRVLGAASDPALAERLDDLAHRDAVEYITLQPEDVARRRLHVHTDRGTEGAIVLGRSERLAGGAVLLLEEERAIVVRLDAQRWLGLRPRDAAAALELGYLAGNLHWKVRFAGTTLWIQLGGDPVAYRERVAGLVADGRATLVEGEPRGAAATAQPREHGDHQGHHHHGEAGV